MRPSAVRIVSEAEFSERLLLVLSSNNLEHVGAVTGPGRSGAVAAVYASHILGIPFIPYGQRHPLHLGRLLIIDTARESGATLRKAERKYQGMTPLVLVAFEEPPRVAFWYEAAKPQRYRHEKIAA
jgi:adenine/guanine phosphoribosyltransferase-like PRPP-binding protein